MKLVQHSLKTIRRQLDVPLRRQMVWVVLFAVAIGGTGFWLIQTAEPQGDEARRDVGSALLSGAVLSTVFVFAERRIEQAVTERQTREQYQLALSMERDLTDRDFSGLNLRGIVLTGRDLSGSRLSPHRRKPPRRRSTQRSPHRRKPHRRKPHLRLPRRRKPHRRSPHRRSPHRRKPRHPKPQPRYVGRVDSLA